MNSTSAKANLFKTLWIVGTLAFLSLPGRIAAQQPAAKTAPAAPAAGGAKSF